MHKNSITVNLTACLFVIITSTVWAEAPFIPNDQPIGTIAQLDLSNYDLRDGNETLFQPSFDKISWSGNLSAYPIDAVAVINKTAERWVGGAAAQVDAQDYDSGRKIITLKDNGSRIPFRWNSLSAAQQASLGDAASGPLIVDFVRGDQSNEIPAGDFRSRLSVLGDIIHSTPYYVYDADHPRVYVGANDGMLHAFNAATGAEIFAYIPSMLLPSLKKLSQSNYAHTYFVDGQINVGTVIIGGNDKTLLVGGLGAGAKGVYALNITEPTVANETGAVSKILWEITPTSIDNSGSGSYKNLGYVYGIPLIVKLNSGGGESGVIIGNGYMNDGNGHASLYIIDPSNGQLIKEIDTGQAGAKGGPNGLSSATAIDINNDGLSDYVYAGDIDGNLWKFDISNNSVASWTATKLFTASHAITSAPSITRHPYGGYLVLFGTGKLLTATDLNDTSIHYIYGIWDGAPASNNNLLDQTLIEKTFTYGGHSVRVRIASSNSPDWHAGGDLGWRTALPAGERVTGDLTITASRRFHTTSTNPTIKSNDTKVPDGENWLLELDYLTGGGWGAPIFNLNGDNVLSDADRLVDAAGKPVPGPEGVPSARFIAPGVLSQPILVKLGSFNATLFNQNPDMTVPEMVTTPGVGGISNGHFDFDIYYGDGDDFGKQKHVHEYDDKYNVIGVNMLNASESAFNLINAIPDKNTRFKLLIANQYLNPAVNLSIGGTPHKNLKELPQSKAGLTVASLPAYKQVNINSFEIIMPPDTFASKDWWGDGVKRAGLIPTKTGCVNNMDSDDLNPTPGQNGEWHNGALTLQLIKDTTPDTAVQLNVPGEPGKGYRVKDQYFTSYVLAEYTTFWHHPNGACFGDGDWTPTPPQDTSTPGKSSAPPAGTADPRAGAGGGSAVYGGISSVTTSSSGGVSVTTITYYDGTVEKITTQDDGTTIREITLSDGTKTVIEIPPGDIYGGGTEQRDNAKTGRISWQQLYKD